MAIPYTAVGTLLGAMGDSAALLKSLLSVTQNARLVTLDLSSADAAVRANLVVERASGREALDSLDGFVVDAISATAYVELKTLIGVEAGLSVLCADGSTRSWYGLVSKVAAIGADGGLARYRLWLSPWPSLLGLREDSFIFQDQTTLETVEALLTDYAPMSRFEIRVSDATRTALPKHAIRTQYRETDLAFLQRVLAADGLSFWIEHDGSSPTSPSTGGGALRHTLVIGDEAHDWPEAAQPVIRYHRLSATESEDAIHGFVAQRQVRTNAVSRSGWNARLVVAHGGNDASTPASDAVPTLEDYDDGADLGRADLNPDTAARIARLRLLAHQVNAVVFRGQSSVRRLAPGTVFTLSGHPDFGDDLVSAATGNTGFGSGLADARFKLRAVTHRMSNNLRTGLDDALDFGERGTYTNTFDCVPAEVSIVPPAPPAPRSPGLLTALVVGVEGEGATTHRDHEVRVQFHFQRGVRPNPGGLTDTGWNGAAADDGNAPGAETSGTWVRVSQALAGPDYGAVFVPRIGTEVLVSFEHGDLDRPLIVGSLHNGQDLPPFQAGVDSGVDHPGVISGIHSKALQAPGSSGAEGYNQLVLDDTAGQLGAQLASSTQFSQVNLGALVGRSPGTAVRGAPRGEGAELATDGWAVFRAGQGGLVSATGRSQAAGSQLDAQEALGQMKGAGALAQALSDAAEAQSAPALTTPKDLDDFGQVLGTTVLAKAAKDPSLSIPAFSAPAILQETPASTALTSPASIVSYASQALHIVAQDQAHFTSGKTVELASGTDTALFTHSGGLTAIAANGPVSIQAHTDELKVLADQSVTVTSTAGKIEILADKKIVLQAGQGSITLEGGNITFAMPGLFSVKGSQHVLAGGSKRQAVLKALPKGAIKAVPPVKTKRPSLVPEKTSYELHYHYGDLDKTPVRNCSYKATLADGEVRTGKLDNNGKATLSGVAVGPVKVSYQYDQPVDDDADIKATRAKIKKVLDQLVAQNRKDYAADWKQWNEAGWLKRGLLMEVKQDKGALIGAWEWVSGTVVSLWQLAVLIVKVDLEIEKMRLLLISGQWKALDQKIATYRAKGQNVIQAGSELKEMLILVFHDEPLRQMLLDFAKDWWAAIPPDDQAELAARVGTQIALDVVIAVILAAFSEGAGGAAYGAAKWSERLGELGPRLAKYLEELQEFFLDLGKALRNRKRLAEEARTVEKEKTVVTIWKKTSIDEAIEKLRSSRGAAKASAAREIANASTHRSGDVDRVVLGRWKAAPGTKNYVEEAKVNGGIWYETETGVFEKISHGMAQEEGDALMWNVNEEFLKSQMEGGVGRIDLYGHTIDEVLAEAPNSFTAKEIKYLEENSVKYGYEQIGNSWVRK